MESQAGGRPVRIVIVDQGTLRPAIEEVLGRSLAGAEIVAIGDPSAAIGLRAAEPDLMIVLESGSGSSGRSVIAAVRAFEAATGRPRLPMLIERDSTTASEVGTEAVAEP